jgi:hypothetical protein
MVYPGAKDPSKPYDSRGKPLRGIQVANAEEERQALGLADEDTPKPTLVPTSAPGTSRVQTPEDEKAQLIQEAEVLGVTIDKRWSVARIQDAIDTHKQAQAVV